MVPVFNTKTYNVNSVHSNFQITQEIERYKNDLHRVSKKLCKIVFAITLSNFH